MTGALFPHGCTLSSLMNGAFSLTSGEKKGFSYSILVYAHDAAVIHFEEIIIMNIHVPHNQEIVCNLSLSTLLIYFNLSTDFILYYHSFILIIFSFILAAS